MSEDKIDPLNSSPSSTVVPVLLSPPAVPSGSLPEGKFLEPKSTRPSRLPLAILLILTLLFASTSVYFFTKLKKVTMSPGPVSVNLPSPSPTASAMPINN